MPRSRPVPPDRGASATPAAGVAPVRERAPTPRSVPAVTRRRRSTKRAAEASPAPELPAAARVDAPEPTVPAMPGRFVATNVIEPPPKADARPAVIPAIAALLAAYADEELPVAEAPAIVTRRPFAQRARERDGRAELLIFRVGREWFALELASVEEAVESPTLAEVPDAPPGVLGVFPLRGRSLIVCQPDAPLGTPLDGSEPVALVIGVGDRRVALLVDLVDDVMETSLDRLRDAPGTEDEDGVLLGVLWRGRDLLSVLDPVALLTRCLGDAPVAA
jgi:purine-binding chemotaxis protein CheW